MKDLAKQIANHSAVRYIFIGGVAFVVEMAALYFFATILSLGPTLGVAISFWIGLVISFTLQKIFSFKNKAKNKKHLTKQMVAYGALVAFNYAFTLLFVSLLEPILTLLIARTIALAITTIWNFYIYSKHIFKNEQTD